MADKVTLELTKTLKGTDGPIGKLEIREPTFKDLKRCGMPISMSNSEIDWNNSSALLEAVTGVQAPVLDQMSIKDTMEAIGILAKFFGESEEATGNES